MTYPASRRNTLSDETIPTPDFDSGPARPRVGAVFLSSDQHGEAAFRQLVEGAGASCFGTRVLYRQADDGEADEDTELAIAVNQLLPDTGIDVLAYSCTSRSATKGEDAMITLLEEARPGVPATTPLLAGRRALEALGVSRIALLSPYRRPLHGAVAAALQHAGISVLRSATFDLASGAQFSTLTSQSIADAAIGLGERGVEAVFISCTGIRAVPVIETVERATGLPVVTSTQALAWHALSLAGRHGAGPGALFNRSF